MLICIDELAWCNVLRRKVCKRVGVEYSEKLAMIFDVGTERMFNPGRNQPDGNYSSGSRAFIVCEIDREYFHRKTVLTCV